jgi:hypothetical protein
MKKILFILLFSPLIGISQHFNDIATILADSSSKSHLVLANASGYISSNSLRSDLYNKFIRGGNISTSLKEKTTNDLNPSVIGGANAEGNFSFINDLSDRFGKGYSLLFSYNQHLFNDIRTDKAIPDMILNGNSKYLGQEVSLKNTSLNLLNYASISAGIFKTLNRGTEIHNFGFSMGLAMGISNTTLDISSGQLAFAGDGSAIDLDALYQLSYSDTSGSRMINGYGWVGSFYYQYVKPEKFALSFSVEDIGQIKWGNTSISEQKKVQVHFEGFQISDIIHIDSNAITHAKDSLVNSIYYPSKVQSYYTQTPCRIGIDGSVHLSKYLVLSASAWSYVNTSQQIGILLKPVITNLIPTLDIAPYVIRNGYSPFDIGLEVTVKTIKNTRIKANIFSFPVNSHTLGGELLVGFRF